MSRRSEQAASTFLAELLPGADTRRFPDSRTRDIIELVDAAFAAYELHWGSNYDVRDWDWPLNALRRDEVPEGNEVWTVLLRRAIEMARPRPPAEPLAVLAAALVSTEVDEQQNAQQCLADMLEEAGKPLAALRMRGLKIELLQEALS